MLIKTIFIILGTISLILGIIGIFIPGLPTTPFLLLTAGLYYRGSSRIYGFLIRNRTIGKRIIEYREKKGVPLKIKIASIAIMWAMIGISSLFTGFPFCLVFSVAGIAGTISMILFLPVAKKN